MLLAGLLFAAMAVCVKLGAERFSATELVFYRGLLALVLLGGYAGWRGLSLGTPHWRAHLWRSLTGFVSLLLYFYALSALPLASAVTLNYTSPIFLALILVLWTREAVRPLFFVALAVGLVGVALLLRPSFVAEHWLAALAALSSGALAGVAYYNVRRLGALGEPEWRVVFHFSLLTTLGGLPGVLGEGIGPAVGLLADLHAALIVLGVGGFGALAQLAMTRAYQQGQTLLTASLAYSTVVFSSLFGILIWHEMPDALAWLGVALIVASGLLASRLSRAPARQD